MPGERCPVCQVQGEEVWVIRGKSCHKCHNPMPVSWVRALGLLISCKEISLHPDFPAVYTFTHTPPLQGRNLWDIVNIVLGGKASAPCVQLWEESLNSALSIWNPSKHWRKAHWVDYGFSYIAIVLIFAFPITRNDMFTSYHPHPRSHQLLIFGFRHALRAEPPQFTSRNAGSDPLQSTFNPWVLLSCTWSLLMTS